MPTITSANRNSIVPTYYYTQLSAFSSAIETAFLQSNCTTVYPTIFNSIHATLHAALFTTNMYTFITTN